MMDNWTREKIEEKVIEIVCKQLAAEKSKVKPETYFVNDLGADSLDTVELVMEVEETFGISVPDEDATKIQTVKDIVDYIEKRLQNQSQSTNQP